MLVPGVRPTPNIVATWEGGEWDGVPSSAMGSHLGDSDIDGSSRSRFPQSQLTAMLGRGGGPHSS